MAMIYLRKAGLRIADYERMRQCRRFGLRITGRIASPRRGEAQAANPAYSIAVGRVRHTAARRTRRSHPTQIPPRRETPHPSAVHDASASPFVVRNSLRSRSYNVVAFLATPREHHSAPAGGALLTRGNGDDPTPLRQDADRRPRTNTPFYSVGRVRYPATPLPRNAPARIA